ncbi:MAG TPA: hypothetical protein VMT25_07045 [Thermoanaerobaculia bacterium]|jgi:hypothetical protein|nr:hypothetical protein [Thermoanaerobaculia bacterium]
MSAPTAGPRCPKCRRPLAAWRLDHCVYCGEAFPAELKQGHEAPDGLKWVERPALPTDLSKKLELMKVVPIEAGRKSRSLVTVIGLLSLPIFAAIFYLLYTMVRRMSPGTSLVVLLAGAGFVGYLAWIFARARK